MLTTTWFIGEFHSSVGKASACNAGDSGSIPGLGRSAGEGKKLGTPVFWPGELHGMYSDFPGGSDGKVSAYKVGDPGSIPGSGRSGEGNSNSLQYSCLENPMDGEAGWATVHGVTKSQTRLSDFTFLYVVCK